MYIVVIKNAIALPPKDEAELAKVQKNPELAKKASAFVRQNKKDVENFISITGVLEEAKQFNTKEEAFGIKAYLDAFSKQDVKVCEITLKEIENEN